MYRLMTWKKQLTVPNILTTLRLLAIPVMAWCIYSDYNRYYTFLIFAAIWLTDCIDGYIARHFNQVSDLGKVLDPLVDKLFQLTTATMMFVVGKLPLWVPIFMFAKEVVMIVGGAILWHRRTVVNSQWFGKLATVLFAAAFASLFFLPHEKSYLSNYIFVVPIAASALALVKYAFFYLDSLWRHRAKDS